MSSLSSEQYQLLIETIKDVEKNEYDDIHLYFEGQIEELKNFKDTSQSTYNTKNRYYKVKPTFIHYNTDNTFVNKIWTDLQLSVQKRMCKAHSRAERGRLRQTTSSRECASSARSAFCVIGNSIGISYYIKKVPE